MAASEDDTVERDPSVSNKFVAVLSLGAIGLWLLWWISQGNGGSNTASRPTRQPTGITFKIVDGLYGTSSSQTDLQNEASWGLYAGECVEWEGELVYVSEGIFGGISIGFKHKPNTFTYDVLIDAPRSVRAQALGMREGQSYTYTATLKDYGGAFLPISADWCCYSKTKVWLLLLIDHELKRPRKL